MKIIAYDFDKTVYDGDSSINFYKYCLKRKPSILKYIPIQLYATVMHYGLKKWPKVKMKEKYFMFLRDIPNIEEWVNDYWKIHKSKLKGWYMQKDHQIDIIISASPEFLLTSICKEIGVKKLIASKVDAKTGKFDGENCYGEEKVVRLNEYMSDYEMAEFYSDSLSDTPLARLAKKSYIVIGDRLVDWKEYEEKHK
ncbi:HAD-IB family phosphatase [Cellulosilyticum ruminicola]|uniref:HAD-IB family phosphatase n=1 Tax=Cellulosilyticum ruminicola TaxID=425254 RepID=UPI0006D19842|nr:HAD-IB family phosphatase [Cellulosilyticum ruminicola]